MAIVIRYSMLLLVLILAQGLVIKYIDLGAVWSIQLEVFILPLFFLFIQIAYPPQLIVLFAFLGGLGVDLFYHTPGLHAGAAVFTGYVRRFILIWLEPRTGYPTDQSPFALDNRRWYLLLTSMLFFSYAISYYTLLLFSIHQIVELVARTVLSGFASILLAVMLSLLIKAFYK